MNLYSNDSYNITYTLILFFTWIISALSAMKLYVKAGKPLWAPFVPFYNGYTFQQIGRGEDKGWTFLICFIPIIGVFYAIYSTFKFVKSFGASTGLAVLSILFAPFVLIYMGFSDDYKYIGPEE